MVCPFKEFNFVNLNFKSMLKILPFLTLVTVLQLKARSQAFPTRIDFQKTQQSAAAIQLPYASGTVEDAVKEYMTKKGYKSSSTKGFIVFRSAPLDSVDTNLSDLYFTIERKSRKESDVTVITLVPAKKIPNASSFQHHKRRTLF